MIFIAARRVADFGEKYTQPARLAISGAAATGGCSSGALHDAAPGTVWRGRCRRSGVLDMLRFNKFTIGWGVGSRDYGSPQKPRRVSRRCMPTLRSII
jgi:prolyl oligopeptidase